jgi:hypothetical protein
MKRRVLKTEATLCIDNRSTGVRQTVKIQVLSAGTVFVSTQRDELQQLDNTGSPVNGTRLTQASPIQDGTYSDFLGQLWMRSDVGADVDITIFNSPEQLHAKPKIRLTIPTNAPLWGKH